MSNALPPTEQPGPIDNLHAMSALQLVRAMHEVDHAVQPAVEKASEPLAKFVDALLTNMQQGGRLFYLGA